MKELRDVYAQICGCRECGLPDGYCPQLRPPGPKYGRGGVVFVQINPGHTGSLTAREIERKYVRQHDREIARRKATNTQKLVSLQSQFVKTPGHDTYETMRNAFLNSMSEHWGWPPGKYGATIQAHGVSLDAITIINLAQCPVPDNSYQRHQLERCWTKWTSQLLTLMEPCVIVAQGSQVWNFLRNRTLPVKAKLVEGVHHADRKSNEDKQKRLLSVRETIRQFMQIEGRTGELTSSNALSAPLRVANQSFDRQNLLHNNQSLSRPLYRRTWGIGDVRK